MQLLPEDFERLAPYFEVGFQHFPALGRVGIRKAVNGPFTFAPDGNPLVGPVRGLRNYWVACAVMAGFSQGGGIGLVLSRWMAESDPGPGHPLDGRGALRRVRDAEVHLAQGAGELRAALPARLPERGAAGARARCAARRSTIGCVAAGAVMGANFGLEHALWFAPRGIAPTETPTYRRSEAFRHRARRVPAVRARRRTLRDHQLRQVRGDADAAHAPGSIACSPAASRDPDGSRSRRCSTRAGRIVGDLSIACLAEDRFLIVGSGFAEEFHLRWFWAASPPADVHVRSAASTLSGVSIAGPRARELLQQLVRIDLSARGVQVVPACGETAVGFAPAILTRAGFTGELGYEIWTTPGLLRDALRRALRQAGRALGPRALRRTRAVFAAPGEGLRLVQQGFPARLHARRNRARSLRRFRQGRVHRPRLPRSPSVRAGPKRRFVIMEVADADAEVVGYESIMKDGAAVGYVTSGAYGHCVDKSLAAGYVPDSARARGRALRDRHPRRDAHGDRAPRAALRSAGPAAARLSPRAVPSARLARGTRRSRRSPRRGTRARPSASRPGCAARSDRARRPRGPRDCS